jgi:dTDP-4-dehydrorhamnose 3,5-epimerase-like enzyme
MPKITDQRGSLTFLQYPGLTPFEIKRVFYLYDMPKDSKRGCHAHVEMEEMLIAVSGSCTVKIYDGEKWETFVLDRPDIGLYIPPLFWRELSDFTEGTVCLTLCSTLFNPIDYLSPIEEYEAYLQSKKAPNKSVVTIDGTTRHYLL